MPVPVVPVPVRPVPVRPVPPGPAEEIDALTIRDDPLRFLGELTARHGALSSHRTGGERVYVLNSPELARRVLKDDYPSYTKAGTPDDHMLSPLLGDGLLTSNGETWARQRHLCAPSFRRAAVEEFGSLMTAAAADLADRWGAAADRQQNVRVDHDLTSLTLRIVVAALLGSDQADLGPGFGRAVDAINRFIGHYDGVSPMTGDLAARRDAYAAAERFLRGVVGLLIAARRLSGDPSGGPSGGHGDLLAAMMGSGRPDQNQLDQKLSDRELYDQVLTMVMAGHETTAKALTWTLHVLAGQPEVADAVRRELRAVLGGRLPTAADLPALGLTRRVVDEVVRLYPPVWLISRRATRDTELGGYPVPEGALVCISPWTLHRIPDWWPDPERFDPDRFLPGPAEARPSHAYLPFGGGPRVCIGQAFALTEAVLVLATILPRLSLAHVPGAPVEPEALVTLRPRNGLVMSVRRQS
jgi:enediyne biosynthesis protein E7